VLSPGKEDEELNKPLSRSNREEESAVGFREAWRIPGVAPFAFCLFLVAYTFLYCGCRTTLATQAC